MVLTFLQSLTILLISLFSLTINAGNTKISIKGENFYVNDKTTYPLTPYKNVEGLLFNSRMIQGIFDDSNQSTVYLWKYPDTKKWDPDRNVDEFVGNLSLYKSKQLLSFTVGLQGGNPFGFGNNEPSNITGQPWIVSAFDFKTGELNNKWMSRLSKVLAEADKLGMIPIINFFYPAQVKRFVSNDIIIDAIKNMVQWLLNTGYENIMIDVMNECQSQTQGPLNPNNGTYGMVETIAMIQNMSNGKLIVSSSLSAKEPVPPDPFIKQCDMVMFHADGLNDQQVANTIKQIRASDAYKANPKPIVINEDNHSDFNSSNSNFATAVNGHTSWGYFGDCPKEGGDYKDGYQCPPVAWNINTDKKTGFFEQVQKFALG